MCNCGNKRNAYAESISADKKNKAAQVSEPQDNKTFEYTGNSGLTVKGNVTGRVYRFNSGGDQQAVDLRDVQGIKQIRSLQLKS